MKNKILEHYDAFYNMVLLTTLLSNVTDERFDEDAKKIIDVIGMAYELSEDIVDECKRLITEELVVIPRNKDRQKFIDKQGISSGNSYLNSMLSIKCDALYAIRELNSRIGSSLDGDWFDYNHYHSYDPQLRYSQIRKAAVTGDLIVNKMIALMHYIGLGTKKIESLAVTSFKQCMMWGDMFSVNMLKQIYRDKNQKQYEIYRDLATLDRYLDNGVTVLPDEVANAINPKAKELYAYISSIKQDIILPLSRNRIDFSFVEVILLDNISYRKKMSFINNYSNPNITNEWKDITNASAGKEAQIGFKVRREDHDKETIL